MPKHVLTFYANRRTARVHAKGSKPKTPKANYGKRLYSRPATTAEETTIKRGGWVGSRPAGMKPSKRGIGPKPKRSG